MKAKYFCGNCSREVNARATVCPWCGSSFTAVRCPRCGFEGKAAEFSDGCPSCGFMMQEDVRVPAAPADVPRKARSGMSRVFYRVAGLVLVVLLAVLVVLLLLRP